MKCPCAKFKKKKFIEADGVKDHLLLWGFIYKPTQQYSQLLKYLGVLLKKLRDRDEEGETYNDDVLHQDDAFQEDVDIQEGSAIDMMIEDLSNRKQNPLQRPLVFISGGRGASVADITCKNKNLSVLSLGIEGTDNRPSVQIVTEVKWRTIMQPSVYQQQ
ncbi:hypothetical protein M9H77_08583 [Catharanthus roseus]|uniref:Uncharacterized protein n=1 Tax=Catharanthus roseus TaxID=4058 RepID=A0ACC0BY59_CATRO|nr:hypothetical protein M9H77_08583 [Catharanthus roseus]